MSKTIDQRVVEMQFDNRQFESGVKTSMSTIDRLKQKLNFKDAGKSFENISAAAKKVDMNGLAKSVDTVKVQFSSLQVVATTALANITNAAVNAGKNLVNSLTLAPIASGFQEYETQMNAIQTILANTQSKGSTLEDVKSALAELNEYADQTIYNFTEMTRNIGTFTAAGVGLDASVNAIKGIANLAAVSGSNAQQASTAMYQLSQALAAGRVSLMDWNSVVNAGMGGEVFQQALIRTAQVMETGVDAALEKYGTFRESLTKGQWLTAEVLTETLSQIAGAYDESTLLAQGYSKEQAAAILQLAETATGAATDVKTFTQLWDTINESIGSGWAQTWQLIIGDFEEAKVFFSEIMDMVDPVISYFTDSRNDLLAGALSSNWDKMITQINEAGVETSEFNEELEKTVRGAVKNYDDLIERNGSLANAFKNGELSGNLIIETLKRMAGVTGETGKATDDMAGKLEYFQKVVNEVWYGDFKNGEERIKALTEAGYDYAQVQDLVNKTVDGHKLTLEDLTDVQLKSVGYTDEEITKLRELAKQAEATGTPLNELINNLTKPSGRELLLDSVKNLFSVILQSGAAVGKAWQNIFPPMASNTLYNMIEGFNQFTTSLANNTEAFDKIRRTLEGVFAILDLITTVVGGGFKVVFAVAEKLLGAFGFTLLDVTAALGDAAVALHDFILDNELVNKGFELLADGIVAAVNAIKGWIDAFLELPIVQAGIENFKNGLSNLKEVGLDAIEGLKQGLQNGLTSIPEILMEIGRRILDAIKGVLGIHSPSTEMYTVGQNIIEGLIKGIKDFASALWDVLSGIGSGIVDILGKIDWGNVFAAALSAAGIVALYKFASALSSIAAPLEGLGDVFEGVGNVLDAFSGTIKSFNFKMKAEAIKTFAIAIAILAGSVAVLAFIPAGQLWNAVGVVAALAAVISGLSIAIGKFGSGSIVDVAKIGGLLLSLSTSFLLLAGVMKIISGMSWDDLTKASAGLMALGMVITGLVAATNLGGNKVNKAGGTILKIAVAMGALVLVGKMIAGMEWSDMGKAAAGLGGLTIIVGALIAVTKLAGNNVDKVGGTILKISIAMGALVLVSKLISGMSWDEMGKAAVGLGGLSAIVGVLIGITKLAGNDVGKIGGTILQISIAMSALVLVAKLISGMSWENMGKAAVGLLGLSAIVGVLIGITRLASDKELARLGTTLLMMSASIGILGGISVLLGMVSTENLVKGITAVGVLSTLMSMMIIATKFAQGSMGNLIVITVAIGILAAAAAALSFIDTTKLLGATAALSILMGSFGLMAKLSGSAKGALGTITVLTLVVGALGGILYLLSGLPVESSLAVATSLSMLLLALSTSMVILSKAGTVSPMALVSIGIMTLIAGGLGALLALITQMNPGPTLEIATSISVLLLSLSAVCLILSAVGATGPAALIGVGIFSAVVVAIGGLMVAIGALIQYFPQLESFLDTGIGLLEKIGYGLGSALGNIVGGFAAGVTSGLPEIGSSLSAFMTNVKGFIDGASGIDPTAFDGIGALAGAIITLTAANVIDAIASWLTGGSSLEDFAASLVPFGESMVEFSNTLTGMDSELVNNAATAGKTLAEMAATLPNSGGVVGWFMGENDMADFGDQLVSFGEAMVEYSQAIAGLDVNAVVNSTVAGKALTELANTVPNSGGVVGWFMGENDMADFAKQIVPFGSAMKAYSLAVAGLNTEAVVNSTIAGKALTELASTVPNTGGLVAFFTGDNDLATFGVQLASFGTSMKLYSMAVTGLDSEAVTTSATIGAALVELADTVPNTGGLVSFFTGDNDLATFGTQLVSFGASMKSYSLAVTGIDTEAITASVSAASELSELASSLENSGGLVSFFSGDNDLGTFGESLSSFGTSLSNYAISVSGIDTSVLSSVITQVYRLISMAESMTGLDTSGMSSFGKALTNLAKADIEGVVTTYTDAYSRVESAVQGLVDAMSSSVSTYSSTFVTSVSTMITDSLTNIRSQYPQFTTSGQELVTNLATGISNNQTEAVKAFEEILTAILDLISQNGSDFNNAGQGLVKELVSGIDSQSKTASNSFTNVLSTMVTSIRNEYANFYNAGGYLVQGFANGISASTYMATAKAQAMAKAAEIAAKNALGVHSPSTVFEEIGENTVEGYEKGIAKKMPAVVDSGEELGDSMIEATKHALDITSDSSELAEKVIGESFVKGITEGIEKDDTAEEAAEKKAQNIVTAFSNALEKVNLSSSTNDLKSQIWEALSENLVSEGQSEAAKLDSLLKEYEYQTQRLELAKAEYQTMVDQFGESSDNAKESYNKYLQEQLDLVNTFNEIVELKKSVSEREGDVLDRQEEQLEREYDLWSEKALGDEEDLNRAQKALLDLAKLTERYEIQVKRVESAKAYYDSLSQAFGKDSKNALEAYDAYLDEYSEQTELSTELYQAQVDQMQWGVTSYGKYLDALKEQKKKNLLSEGLSEEEADKKIDSLFRNFNRSTESIAAFVDEFREIVTGSFATVANDTTTAYMESVDETFGPMTEEFKQYGESYAEALNEGFKEGMASSNSDKVVVNAGSAEVDSGSKSDLFAQMQDMFSPITGESSTLNQDISSVFNNLGKNAMSEFVSGMQSEISDVDSLSSSVTSMIEQIGEEMQNVLGGDSFSAQGQMDTATVPELAQPLLVFFQTLAEYIRVLFAETYQKTWFDVGVQILTFIIDGIEDTTPEMESIVQTFMNNFLNAVLWFESMFYQAGQTLALSILYGFKSEEYRFIQYANELGVIVGSAMVAGFESGLASARSYIQTTGQTMVESVVNAAMTAMDAHSPSRLFMKIGSYIPLGFAIGINNEKDKAVNSALSMVQDTISRVAEAVDSGMDVEPTIRPVLDLSNVEEGTKRISAMFSRNQALSIDRSMSGGRSTIDSVDQNGDTTSESGNTFNFTQNNYSPKSLSRVEIYRQTKNQFSTFQRMVRV